MCVYTFSKLFRVLTSVCIFRQRVVTYMYIYVYTSNCRVHCFLYKTMTASLREMLKRSLCFPAELFEKLFEQRITPKAPA